MRIAVIAPQEPEAFFDLLWQGVWEATFDIAQFGVEVADITQPRHDIGAQRAILTELLQERVDAIALVPMHSSDLNDLIERHVARGTAVVTFHSDAPQSARTLHVGPDAFHSGVLAGELLAKLMGRRGRILTIPGPRHEYHVAQRYDGLRREVERYAGLNEVIACTNFDLAGDFVELIRCNGPIDGIYVGSEQIAEVAKTLQLGALDIPCVGFTCTADVEPFLRNGVVAAVIDGSRFQQGYFAVQKAYAAAAQQSGPAPPGIRIPSSVVLASNLNDAGAGQSLNEAFEGLIFQRTAGIIAHQKMLQEANAKLENLANTDPLTGLFNRRRFQEALRYEIDRTRRSGEVSLMMIDLNFFKLLNDQYGHNAGDEALKIVAQLLRSRCRSTDICARLGGDEFSIILPQTAAEGSAIMRQAIVDLIEQANLPWHGEELRLSLSVGTATFSRETCASTSAPEDLMAAADADMYRRKLAQKAHRPLTTPVFSGVPEIRSPAESTPVPDF
ncbi:MAG: diguanylate cyclase [Bryobacteraceae bacterium]